MDLPSCKYENYYGKIKLSFDLIWACEHDKGMTRVMGKKKILELKHIFTSVGE
jgi:hypothetical protein